jgi:hypothetical protein
LLKVMDPERVFLRCGSCLHVEGARRSIVQAEDEGFGGRVSGRRSSDDGVCGTFGGFGALTAVGLGCILNLSAGMSESVDWAPHLPQSQRRDALWQNTTRQS